MPARTNVTAGRSHRSTTFPTRQPAALHARERAGIPQMLRRFDQKALVAADAGSGAPRIVAISLKLSVTASPGCAAR